MSPIFVHKLYLMHLSPELLEGAWDILFVLFLAFAFIQLVYVLFMQSPLLFKQKETPTNKLPSVSVVVCARNESDNLFKHLPTICEQNYPNFEVIVVNHQSIDDSKYILFAFVQQYKNLRVVEIARNEHMRMGKKLPLSVGIKGAKNEVLLTDADCSPSSKNWLKLMVETMDSEKELVLGYGPYHKKPGLLNRLIRFDTAWVGMNFLGSARIGNGYMAVGRNFAYKKATYEKVNGFKSHYSVMSGDDDLFFQEVAKKGNHAICIDPDAFCFSEAEDSWESWLSQKKRHLSASKHYKVIKKALLGIYPLTLLLMVLSFVILLSNHTYQDVQIAVFGGVVLIKWLIQARCFVALKEKKLAWAIPFFELLYFLILPVILISLNGKKTSKWR
jgi:cellulose synthase/poly-beta-1,6-N-acetylglucosamine synthase-like glycosyltransferase